MRGTWPDGRILAKAPVAARYAAHIARELRTQLDGRPASEIAAAAGLAKSTVYDLINGTTWGDMVSLAKLEQVLGARLWPADPNDV